MTAAIETEGLTKRYGDTQALSDLSIAVGPGEIFGFLGPNGAGKTTTIRLLMDLIRPTAGSARVLGHDISSSSIEVRRRVGYLPGELALYERLTARETFSFLGSLRNGVPQQRVEELSDLLELDLDRPIRDLSKGNKQKVGLVQAFMHDPEVLILDEPTSGLDPLVQRHIHRLLREAKSDGRTVFLSSHVLHEVEEIADRVAIIRRGELVAVESMDDLRAKALSEIEVRFGSDVPIEELERLPSVRETDYSNRIGRFKIEGSVDGFVKALANYEVLTLTSFQADLDEIFYTFYEGGDR